MKTQAYDVTFAQTAWDIVFYDPIAYHEATMLARIVDWCALEKHKQWLALEKHFLTLPLQVLPWLYMDWIVGLPEVSHPLTKALLRVVKCLFLAEGVALSPTR